MWHTPTITPLSFLNTRLFPSSHYSHFFFSSISRSKATEDIPTVVGIIGMLFNPILQCPIVLPLCFARAIIFAYLQKQVGRGVLMWIYYGMPFVHPHSVLVITINSIGLFLQMCYLSMFFFFTGKKYRLQIVGILLGEVVVMAAVIDGTMLGLHTYANRTTVVGVLATIFGICMYGAPLSIMFKVIKTKSAEFLPKTLSVACFLNGICWAIYALLKFDPYILTGNGVGALLALVQLVLIILYRNPPKVAQKPSKVELQNVV